MQKINTVIFDLGGVLVDWDPRHMYRKLFTDEGEMEWFLQEVCNGPWNHAQDAGRSFAEGVSLKQAAFPAYATQIAAFWTRWPEMMVGAKSDIVAIQQRLISDDRYRVLALTNWSAETFPFAQARFDFLADFEGTLVSGEEKLAKPDPAIYQRMMDKFSLDPAHCCFIDDSPTNVAAAWKFGIHSHRFTDAERLETWLTALP